MRILCGSRLLELNNSKDIDYIVTEKDELLSKNKNEDLLYYSPLDIENNLKYYNNNFGDLSITQIIRILNNYAFDDYFSSIRGYSLYPIYHFSFIEHKEQIINLISYIKKSKILCYHPDFKLLNGYMEKSNYLILATQFFIKNNICSLTEMQKEDVQKIHDGRMS